MTLPELNLPPFDASGIEERIAKSIAMASPSCAHSTWDADCRECSRKAFRVAVEFTVGQAQSLYSAEVKRIEELFRPSLKKRFWAKVKKSEDGCWEWQGSITAHRGNFKGYGIIAARGGGVLFERAHRVSWRFHFGLIPEGMVVMHKCDNPLCVRPDHLQLGTQKENMHDMIKKRRFAKGNELVKAKVTEEQVRHILTCKETNASLGRRYGVNYSTISNIRARRTWKWVTT